MVREGSLSLVDSNGFEIVLAKGEAASLPASSFAWKAQAADCVILTIHQGTAPVSFTKLDLDHPMVPGGAPNAALLTTPAPTTHRHEFQSDDPLSWGIWATTPYARHPINYSFSELMMLRKGDVTLSNPDEGACLLRQGTFSLFAPALSPRGAILRICRSFGSSTSQIRSHTLVLHCIHRFEGSDSPLFR